MTPPSDVLVLIEHPAGALWVPLEEWARTGPGPRFALRPSKAKHAQTGEALPLVSSVPLEYRNDAIACRAILDGALADPWAEQRAAWHDAGAPAPREQLAFLTGSRPTRWAARVWAYLRR